MKSNNKILMLFTTMLTSALAITIFAVNSGNANLISTFANEGDNHNHSITFDYNDFTQGDDGTIGPPGYQTVVHNFTLSKKNAIIVSETEKYDISTVGAYWEGDSVSVKKDGYIVTFGEELSSISVRFQLTSYANVDLEHSYILYNKTNDLEDTSEPPEVYGNEVYFSTPTCYYLKFKSITLTFSC